MLSKFNSNKVTFSSTTQDVLIVDFKGVIIFYLTGGCGRNGMKDSV